MASLPEHLSSTRGDRGELPREVREIHQRDRVITASIEVFGKRGFRGTTVDHIVEASQVSFRTFYSLFDGKEDCFLHVYDRILADGHERISAAVPPGLPWAEQAVIVLRALVELISTEPMRARVALIESQTGGPRALASYQEMIDSVIPLLRRGREESPGAAGLSPTLEEAILGGVVWLLHQQLLKGGVDFIAAIFPELVDIVVGPYAGAEAAAQLAKSNIQAANSV
jgi:AcrR family transcriptional regulator